jgi:hypothetical protein
MPESIKTLLAQLIGTKTPSSSSAGGRIYWAHCVRQMGLVDTELRVYPVEHEPRYAKSLTIVELRNCRYVGSKCKSVFSRYLLNFIVCTVQTARYCARNRIFESYKGSIIRRSKLLVYLQALFHRLGDCNTDLGHDHELLWHPHAHTLSAEHTAALNAVVAVVRMRRERLIDY